MIKKCEFCDTLKKDGSWRNNTWVVGAAETHENKNCKRYLKNIQGEKTLL